MPAKKKKKNPPVKTQVSQKQRNREDSAELVKKVFAATVVSSVIMLSISAWAASSSPTQTAPGGRVFQFLPPLVGILAALFTRQVKNFFNLSWSDTITAALISAVLSLAISGLVVLFG